MSTAYQTLNFAQSQPAGTGHGVYKNHTSLHTVSPLIATWAAGDTIAVGYLPRNAVVNTAILKAASQLDGNGTPTLSLDVGIVGNTQLFKAAITTVGRAAGASADITNTGAGYLYQNTSGAKQEIIITVHAAAATPVAGTLEIDVEYYVEDVVGSNP